MNPSLRKQLFLVSAIAFGFFLALGLAPSLQAQVATPTTTPTLAQLDWFKALVLGLVQGLTEFLPISSTAHLKVIPVLFGWGDPGVTFTAVIQLGSIAAVLWYFWEDLRDITLGMIKAITNSDYDSQSFRLGMGILLGTIPIIICGFALKKLVPDLDNSPLRSMTAIAIASIVMSSILALAEKLSNHKRDFNSLQRRDGILMGLAQALALMPGVSRSGSTITAGLFLNLERATAARFSFLLGIPAITLAGLVEFKDVLDQNIAGADWIPLIVGVISAAVSSYWAIAWLLDFLKKQNTWIFIWYRLAFGLFLLFGVSQKWRGF